MLAMEPRLQGRVFNAYLAVLLLLQHRHEQRLSIVSILTTSP
jgi:hypothetical protein